MCFDPKLLFLEDAWTTFTLFGLICFVLEFNYSLKA